MIDCLIDWLIDWLIGWLIDWLIDRLIDWLIDWVTFSGTHATGDFSNLCICCNGFPELVFLFLVIPDDIVLN